MIIRPSSNPSIPYRSVDAVQPADYVPIVRPFYKPVDHIPIRRSFSKPNRPSSYTPDDAAQTIVPVPNVHSQNPERMHVITIVSSVQGLTVNPPSLPIEVVVVFEAPLEAILDAELLLEVVDVLLLDVVAL